MTRADAELYRAAYLAELMLKTRHARQAQSEAALAGLSSAERVELDALIGSAEREKDRQWPSPRYRPESGREAALRALDDYPDAEPDPEHEAARQRRRSHHEGMRRLAEPATPRRPA